MGDPPQAVTAVDVVLAEVLPGLCRHLVGRGGDTGLRQTRAPDRRRRTTSARTRWRGTRAPWATSTDDYRQVSSSSVSLGANTRCGRLARFPAAEGPKIVPGSPAPSGRRKKLGRRSAQCRVQPAAVGQAGRWPDHASTVWPLPVRTNEIVVFHAAGDECQPLVDSPLGWLTSGLERRVMAAACGAVVGGWSGGRGRGRAGCGWPGSARWRPWRR